MLGTDTEMRTSGENSHFTLEFIGKEEMEPYVYPYSEFWNDRLQKALV